MPQPPLSEAEKLAYDRGFRDALDKRTVYVDLETEMAMPVEWSEYSSKEEREVIAAIVALPEYQEYLKTNLIRQAMLKWRQARLAHGEPFSTKLLFEVGNFIMELVEFFEHAKDQEEQKVDQGNGFDSFPEPV